MPNTILARTRDFGRLSSARDSRFCNECGLDVWQFSNRGDGAFAQALRPLSPQALVNNVEMHAFRQNYPSATSSVIITAKPTIAPSVAISLLPPDCDSGITSSTVTKIIAPAANASA